MDARWYGIVVVAFLASGGNFILAAPANAAGHALKNPIIRKPEAIKAGRALYAEHCMICHGQKGGRGPDLFENALTDQEFLTTAMEGKSGNRGQMPSWAGVLSVKQIWEIEAFVKSRPRF